MTDFHQIEEFLISQGTTQEQIRLFSTLFHNYKKQVEQPIEWDQISTPSEDSIIPYQQLDDTNETRQKELLSKLSVCRLNGGLGTSMGCVGPKSAIEVRNGQSFLDLIVHQIHALNEKFGTDVPLVLMNSFNTDQDTSKIIKKYDDELDILTFRQNELTRLRKDSWMPLSKRKYGEKIKYPPGHGDIYYSIGQSGILDELIQKGKKYMFIANADNLGASVDMKILDYMDRVQADFVMEVTDKTRSDVKGGTLVKTSHQPLKLLEFAQVPKEYHEEFKSIKKFKIFNTNNIWVNLERLKQKIDEGSFVLDVFLNHKQVKGLPVIQLETAIGSGINCFEKSLAVKVPRTRFLPVKTTNDLLLVQSNLFVLEEGVLKRNNQRQFENLPLIRLGDYYKTVNEYQKRIEVIPDIIDLDHLTVVGNVFFGRHIKLSGNVILVCESGELNLPNHAFLENKVLTGNIKMGEL